MFGFMVPVTPISIIAMPCFNVIADNTVQPVQAETLASGNYGQHVITGNYGQHVITAKDVQLLHQVESLSPGVYQGQHNGHHVFTASTIQPVQEAEPVAPGKHMFSFVVRSIHTPLYLQCGK